MWRRPLIQRLDDVQLFFDILGSYSNNTSIQAAESGIHLQKSDNHHEDYRSVILLYDNLQREQVMEP